MSHFHVASGLAGYGPELDEESGSYSSLRDVADVVCDELKSWSDFAYESAHCLAESGEYEEAWKTLELSESLQVRAANLDNSRSSAPLYEGRPELWEETLRTLLADFPVDVSHNSRLYVWTCDEETCEEDLR